MYAQLLTLCLLAPNMSGQYPQPPEHLPTLLRNLNDPRFSIREAASRELLALGGAAVPALRRLSCGYDEAARRASHILYRYYALQPRDRDGVIWPTVSAVPEMIWLRGMVLPLDGKALAHRYYLQARRWSHNDWDYVSEEISYLIGREATALLARELLSRGAERNAVSAFLESMWRSEQETPPPPMEDYRQGILNWVRGVRFWNSLPG